MDCKSELASHYAGCPCHEERWRERLAAAESRAERLAEALREIASACECGFPRCQSNVARAAFAEYRDASAAAPAWEPRP